MRLILFTLSIFINTLIFSQNFTVSNVKSKPSGRNVLIMYDLTGATEDARFSIQVQVSTDGGKTFSNPLKEVSGDVGFNKPGGIGKQIIWDALKEVSQLISNEVVFKVKAEIVPEFLKNMVLVDGGSFMMGNDAGTDDKPAHQVSIDAFYIGKYEITVKEFKEFCKETSKALPEKPIDWIDNHPMTFVNWDDANAYCAWLTKKTGKTFRLPTEAEWEYAAHGGKNGAYTKYSGSDNVNDVAWHKNNSAGVTHSVVGSLNPNNLGLFDMSGNVWEWCSDWYSNVYYVQSPSLNPKGPRAGTVRSGRGGSWYHGAVPLTYRFFMSPTASSNYMGFRIVMEP